MEDVGEGSKTVAVKTADGTKETFVVADHAVVNSGKDIASYSARVCLTAAAWLSAKPI